MCSAISPVIKAVHQLFPIREETRYEAIFATGKKEKRDGGKRRTKRMAERKKERIMNKGKKGKKKGGEKNTEFVTSRN